MRQRAALVFIVGLLVAGCATREPPETDDGEVAEPTQPPASEEDEARQPAEPAEDKPAVTELTRRAETASADGDQARAVRLLERALRLSPRNAGLWQNLAVVRYRQGRYADAETLAQRSNRWSSSDPELRRRNWSLIEAARRKRGDGAGAREARQRASAIAEKLGSP
jgi:Flp pilus assembly protein TadD